MTVFILTIDVPINDNALFGFSQPITFVCSTEDVAYNRLYKFLRNIICLNKLNPEHLKDDELIDFCYQKNIAYYDIKEEEIIYE